MDRDALYIFALVHVLFRKTGGHPRFRKGMLFRHMH
jgi:hypothetical protein